MNILKKLSLKSLKLNKKRTIGTIIGIILSTSLICAVAGMFTSFQQTLIVNAINESGYYHLELYNLSDRDINDLNANRKIDSIKTIYDLGYSSFNHENKDEPYIHVYSTDYFDDLSFNITEGRKPENSNELIINKKVMMEANLKIGDTITLTLGTRVTFDGYPLDDSNPYIENEEELVNTKTHTYKIVGTFKKYGYNYRYYAFTTKEENDKITAYASLKNPKNYKTDIPFILGHKDYDETLFRDWDNSKYEYEVNNELLRWEAFAFSDSTVSMLTTVVSIVIGIIIVSSVFCIRNSFAISANEKTKIYGMLASVGATKKQIKKSVIYEGFILGLIGIPLGILSGIFAVFVLIKIVNQILGGKLFESLDEIVFHISIMSIIVSIILGFITIYFSCLSAARKASRISPIENVKNSENIKLNSKKLNTPKIINKIFGIGGSLAYKNLKRSKKKYRTTVISIMVSIFVFISMNSFLTETFDLSNKYYTEYDYNLVLSMVDDLSETDISNIRKINDIKTAHVIYDVSAHNNYIKISDKNKLNFSDELPINKDCEDNVPLKECDKIYRSLELIALDDITFKDYIKKLNLNYDAIKTKGILVDEYMYNDYTDGKEKRIRSYNYKTGDVIKGNVDEKDLNIEIGSIATIRPFGYENRWYSGGYLIVNKDYYEELNLEPYRITIDANNVDEVIKNIESISSDIEITNYEETKKQDHAMKLVISIFLYGFITVITLIGVTTIFNTISSNMELRSKEFAMLKSIGMTKKEFKHMINLETLFYSFKSLLYGIILGLIGSYALHKAFAEKNETAYQIPYIPIILGVIFVFLIVYIIMRFSMVKINKQNTIETIRKENI